MAGWSADRWNFFTEVMRRNTEEFYRRWRPGTDKSGYIRYHRTRFAMPVESKGVSELIADAEIRISVLLDRSRQLKGRVKRKLGSIVRRVRGVLGFISTV
jgi:hypothetical protein